MMNLCFLTLSKEYTETIKNDKHYYRWLLYILYFVSFHTDIKQIKH